MSGAIQEVETKSNELGKTSNTEFLNNYLIVTGRNHPPLFQVRHRINIEINSTSPIRLIMHRMPVTHGCHTVSVAIRDGEAVQSEGTAVNEVLLPQGVVVNGLRWVLELAHVGM